MIKNLKYRLKELCSDRQVRIGGMAFLVAIALLTVTLLECPIHTIEISQRQNVYTLNKMYSAKPLSTTKAVSYPVFITSGETTQSVEFTGGTVEYALKLAGFTPNSGDYVEPSLDTEITETAYIDYIPGEKQETGSAEVLSTNVTLRAEKKARSMGSEVKNIRQIDGLECISTLTPKMDIELDSNGVPTRYKKKLTARATAYTYTGNNCSTGVAPQPGYIAVNPKYIPYGTKMFIKSPNGKVIYGYAVAADTGGFIKQHPTGVDLFMATEAACRSFGVRQMEIYILE